MKKRIALLWVLALLLAGCGEKTQEPTAPAQMQQAGVLKVGISTSMDQTYATSLGQILAQGLKLEAQVVAVEPERAVQMLRDGEIHCLVANVTADEAAEAGLTASVPYLVQQQCVITGADIAKSYSDRAAFAQWVLAAEQDSPSMTLARELWPQAELVAVESQEAVLAAVAEGKAQGGVLPLSVAGMLTGEESEYPELDVCDLVDLGRADYVICLGQEDLVESVNEVLNGAINDGTIAALAEQFGLEDSQIAG